MTATNSDRSRQKLQRVERTIEAQKAYMMRVPDPDNRSRAESNLMSLVHMRDDLLLMQASHAEG